MLPSREGLTAMALLAMRLSFLVFLGFLKSSQDKQSMCPTVQPVHTQSSPSAVPPLVSLKAVQGGALLQQNHLYRWPWGTGVMDKTVILGVSLEEKKWWVIPPQDTQMKHSALPPCLLLAGQSGGI